ncbi:MAG: T9SS type A sorting domain-containing protein [Saprospiraceae bacterium]
MKNRCWVLLVCLLFFIEISGQTFETGKSYFGLNDYVEYIAGDLPVIISAPHGGDQNPSAIPDRDCNGCVTVSDAFTQELAREIYQALLNKMGCHSHIILNRLHRRKLDANRDLDEAANGNTDAAAAWFTYHNFIEAAKTKVIRDFGRGLFIDLHGHGHTIQRLELGYLLTASELRESDVQLNTQTFIENSSLRNLVQENLNKLSHSELIRGKNSLGSILSDASYPSVPASDDPFPVSGDAYFSGGYNTERHGSITSGKIDAIQIECNSSVRFNANIRIAFAENIADAIIKYLDAHYFKDFKNYKCISSIVHKSETFFEIFPNPVIDRLSVKNSRNFELNLSVYDQMGRLISSKIGDKMDVSELQQGLYFLKIAQNNTQMTVKKFVKM